MLLGELLNVARHAMVQKHAAALMQWHSWAKAVAQQNQLLHVPAPQKAFRSVTSEKAEGRNSINYLLSTYMKHGAAPHCLVTGNGWLLTQCCL